jgi:hypothetical protein
LPVLRPHPGKPYFVLADANFFNRAHVKNDLDAYVCLFEECDTPEELYNHSNQWLRHLRGHTLRWCCSSKSHGRLFFITRDDYMDHMRNLHKGAFTEAQLRVLAERNARTAGPVFESCPLCGVEEVKGRLEDHIVGHLRFLALKSLPPYQDEGSEGSRSEIRSIGTSKLRSRSTVKQDPERYLKPTFDDFGEQQSTQGRDGGGGITASPYEAWGGYRSYIDRFPVGLREAPMATDGTTLGIGSTPPQHFPQPHIPEGEEYQLLQWSEDPSAEFVEESLFTGVLDMNWRHFEWGFLIEVDGSPERLENDSIIQSILKRKLEEVSQESILLTQPKEALVASGTTDEHTKVVSNDLESRSLLEQSGRLQDIDQSSVGAEEATVEESYMEDVPSFAEDVSVS